MFRKFAIASVCTIATVFAESEPAPTALGSTDETAPPIPPPPTRPSRPTRDSRSRFSSSRGGDYESRGSDQEDWKGTSFRRGPRGPAYRGGGFMFGAVPQYNPWTGEYTVPDGDKDTEKEDDPRAGWYSPYQQYSPPYIQY
jgi:hypothetical protein